MISSPLKQIPIEILKPNEILNLKMVGGAILLLWAYKFSP
jgi:hypothetical protein